MGWAVIAKTCQRFDSLVEVSPFELCLGASSIFPARARAFFGDSPTLTGNFLPRRDIVSDLEVL